MTAGGDDGGEADRRLGEIRSAAEGAVEPEPGGGDGRVVRLGAARSPRPEGSGAGLVLDPKAPLAAARLLVERDHTLGGVCTLRHWRDSWVRWNGSCYEILGDRPVRTWLYKSMEKAWRVQKRSLAPFDPSSRQVSDVLDALKAAVALDDAVEPPAWLGPAPIDDRPPASEFVAVHNGLVHLPSRELWSPDPSFFALGAPSINYDPDAPEPAAWLAFLGKLWGGDPASIDCLQELIGYWISGETAQQKIALLVGPTRSGKSTIARIVTQLLGTGSVTAPALADFGGRFGLESLVGKGLAIVADARLSDRTDQAAIVERMLSISGEDVVTVDRKYREPWCGRLGTRLLLISNEAPILRDTSGAMQNRFVVLRLTETFLGAEDIGLPGRLLAELPGIFNWALEGWHRLRARGHFEQPESAAEIIRAMADLASPVSAFLRDRCLRSGGLKTEQIRLYKEFGQWLVDQGRDGRKITKNRFTRELSTLGITVGQSRDHEDLARDRVRVYRGVGLMEP